MREEEFFREALSKTARVKNGNNIVEALKSQNERSHFIAAMKDQRGLPVWGKMKPLYTTSSQNKSGDVEEVYSVPLIMNGWITSVLYVGMKDNNVQNLRSITNTDLWDIINNGTVDKKMRESLLLNCLLYDAEIFGTDVFINIPTGLLGAEAGKNSVRSVGQSEESGETNSLFAVCISWTSNCTCGGGSCDHCNEDGQCVSNYECIGGGGGIPNGEGDSNGHGTPGDTGSGGGGGGGNQGGSGGDEGDDCSLDNKPFYKIVPGCDYDGDGSGENGGVIDPCANIKTQRENTVFQNKITDLQGKTGLKKETGYIQKNGGDYEYQDNAGATDQHNSLSLPSSETNTYIKGYMHTHVNDFEDSDGQTRKGVKVFSPADMSYFMDMVKNAQDAARPLENVYAIMVSNTVNYQIRFTGNQYQIKTFTDAQRNAFRDSYTTLMGSRIGNQKLLELGFLQFISEKMNLKGVGLYRMNTDGTTTGIALNMDKTDTVEANCPN